MEIDCTLENVPTLIESTEKFKRIHRVEFATHFDASNNLFILNLEGVSVNNTFLIGYYYGALWFIGKSKFKEL
ncbi:hypothetical protein IUY40_00035 [Flavobacterium sp. ALJ2]|uniref:hypothetical protein n=1 Tax=Flavobacterium sp. ALJ2 TaxID=2786960 RepID=UPI00189D1474|nr:hypothetical protein [Flavobacterium sp. ALJ2]MBF7089938.1 hypothetical protein [Flavobacterium sp. ALJ2]